MGARLRSWWQQIKIHRVTILYVTIILIIAIGLIIVGYRFDWTGFNGNNKSGKTLWDWMQLLFIPVVLAIAGFWFNHRERKAAELRAEAEREIEQWRANAEREIALDNQREEALQAYLDKMSELLLHEKLLESQSGAEERNIAFARTVTMLYTLDARRTAIVIRFLSKTELIAICTNSDLHAIDLHQVNLIQIDLNGVNLVGANLNGADLRDSDLSRAFLNDANLSGTNLSKADLQRADLRGADLHDANLYAVNLHLANLIEANLRKADLHDADLSDAYLACADLSRAIVSSEQLEKAKSLKGATMPV
ncbi:MAG TPA: pentapeptide repeat-containing protein [Ktedonobacteraceae bacterium]